MTTREIKLAAPTNRVVEGPRFALRATNLVVEYDVEQDSGARSWHAVEFGEVLDFEFRSSSTCGEDDVVSATVVRQGSRSERLDVILAKWEASVGWQAWNQERGGRDRFHEFTLFFDDVGAVVVVASSCTVRS